MSSATARFFSLLSTPFPLRHLHHTRLSLLRLSTTRLFFSLPPPLLSSPHLPRRFHFKAHSLKDEQSNDSLVPPASLSTANGGGGSSLWPEWYKLVNSFKFSLDVRGNFVFGEFVGDGEALPRDFIRAANACLAFAREHEHCFWSLPRKDIEVVVENGSPFLFKDAEDTMRRMKLFLNGSTYHVLGSDKPNTVDLMKFLLSYASTALVSSETNSFNNREIVEASVRRLFSEFAEISASPGSANTGSLQTQFPGTYGQLPMSSAQHVQMKKGDWICPRCRFMNFARNMKCLECEELRPKRQLTGGEWECPQCDFFNYGRNMVCLRCDCKKPDFFNPVAGSGYNNYSNSGSSGKQSTDMQEKAKSWFSKLSKLENTSSGSSAPTEEVFPETIPLKEGIISESNTLKQSDNESRDVIGKGLDKMLAQSSDISSDNNWDNNVMGNNRSRSSNPTPKSVSPQYGTSYKSSNTMEDKDKEQDEKSQRWFKRVAELHDVKDLPSAVHDEDFPEVMPMRKGETRFVVREKKDRSLTSPLYKRRVAMEQSGSSNYVPFVPFPPNYFAKDKQPVKYESPAGGSTSGNSSMPSAEEHRHNISSRMGYGEHPADQSSTQPLLNQQSWDKKGAREIGNEKSAVSAQRTQNYMHQAQKSSDSPIISQGFSSGKYHTSGSEPEMRSKALSQPADNKEAMNPWRGSSLEGSAVKEPDPLDMSEEAKAERWFRRVAQIKDIKELSEIPDEDFPSIMPMRKGVNRFVVSRRKTPLERRLASSQYRRNLPVVKSDPPKDIDNIES